MTDAFIQALADAAEDDLFDLDALRVQCIAKIAGGGGEVAFTVNAALNGKAASQECKMDASELLAVVNQAVRLKAGTAVGITYVDFSDLR